MRIDRRAVAGLVVLIALPLLAGGCALSERAITLNGPAEFQAIALGAQDPALVMFYKDGCEACEEMEPMIDSLATLYKGRAVVARLMVVSAVRTKPWPEINAKYDITMVPTVILFVGGQEKQRWVAEFDKERYKEALGRYVRPAAQPARAAGGPPTGY
jgi:thioredoxin-like negative regulator of GroEL